MTDDDLRQLRGLAEGMASGQYVADPSPYHAELLTMLLEAFERLRDRAIVRDAIRREFAEEIIAEMNNDGSELNTAYTAELFDNRIRNMAAGK